MENEIINHLNYIRELKDTAIVAVQNMGNDPLNLAMDIAFTSLVLAESNLLLALSNIEKVGK